MEAPGAKQRKASELKCAVFAQRLQRLQECDGQARGNTCDVDAVGTLAPHRPFVVSPSAGPPLVAVTLSPYDSGGTEKAH